MEASAHRRRLRCHASHAAAARAATLIRGMFPTQKAPRLPARVKKQRVQELEVLAKWRGSQAEPGSATWVETSHRRDLDIKNQIRQNVYLRPTRAVDGMPRDPETLRYHNHQTTEEKIGPGQK